MSIPRIGFENKKDCSNCGRKVCLAIVKQKYTNEEQAESIMACQNTYWYPVRRESQR